MMVYELSDFSVLERFDYVFPENGVVAYHAGKRIGDQVNK